MILKNNITFIKQLLSVILCFTAISAQAQTKIRVLDESNESIEGVKVVVLSEQNERLFRGITNEFGELTASNLELKSTESIKIQATMLGFLALDTLVQKQQLIELNMNSDLLDQDEVVVTAQYGSSSTENSVHRIKVIDRQKIDAMGAVNLRDVLSNELGVRIAQDNILGSSMTLQGVSGENVKILLDGVPVVGRLNGNVDLSQINLQEIDHIEIVEGPLSVNYGTNALAGVINLISKKPTFNRVNGSISSYYESTGHYNLNGELNYGAKNWAFGISGGRSFFDGWSDQHTVFKNPTPIADSNRFMTWKPKEQVFGGFYAQLNKNGWLVRYKANYFSEFILNRGYPRAPYQETAFDDHYHTLRVDNSINIKKKVGAFGLTKHTFAYNRYDRTKNTYFVDLTTLDQNITNDASDQDTSVFDQWVFRGNYMRNNDSSAFNFEIGYDILIESASGIRIESGRKQQADLALFASSQYQPVESLIIRTGLRYAYNTTYKTPIIPSLNVKWGFAKNWNFRTSYARGFRAPSIKELYFEFVDINHNIIGNDNLSAENSHNAQASINHKWKSEKMSIQSELSGFYNSITDRISLASISSAEFTYVNIGSFKSNGLRLSTKIQHQSLTLTVGSALIGSASNLVADELKNTFVYYPELQSSAMYTVKKSGTSFGLFYKYQGELPNFTINSNDEVEQIITEDYHLLDFTLSQKMWKERLILTIGSKNILNVTQIASFASGGTHSASSNSLSVGNGRSYFVSMKMNLSKRIKSKK